MERILKYKLDPDVDGKCVVSIPSKHSIIHIDYQHDNIWLWAIVEEDSAVQEEKFHIAATGEVLDLSGYYHIGTVLTPNGTFVWHVFNKEDSYEDFYFDN